MLLVAPPTIYIRPNQALHQIVATEFKALNKTISAYLAELPDVGAAIAVADDKQIIWEDTYGFVDGEGSWPIDRNSTTKYPMFHP